jgi:putative hydrolase
MPEDMHVHSTFSDGKNSIEENVAEAESQGLDALGCVDHVRVDTTYVPEYVQAVKRVSETTPVRLQCGIEAKLLDTTGALDLPTQGVDEVDAIYAADHQVPLADGPHHPREVCAAIESRELPAREVLEALVTSTAEACRRHDNVVIAHLFSVLPKIGLDEEDVPLELIDSLAQATQESGSQVEVSERWRCPSVRTLRPFVERGLTVRMSTDSHRREHIGRYDYCTTVMRQLGEGA